MARPTGWIRAEHGARSEAPLVSGWWGGLLAATLAVAIVVAGGSRSLAQEPTRKLDPNWFYGVIPDPPAGWRIGGSFNARWEYYEVTGDRTQGPYPYLGLRPFTDFNFNGFRRFSSYEFLRINLAGVLSYSDYRSAAERGLIFERFAAYWQKGDAKVPFRLKVGDHYAFQSVRTIQRSLKGFNVELQPNWSGLLGKDARHSLVAFSGITSPIYRNLKDKKEVFSGASWLVSRTPLGDFSANFVHGFAERDPLAGVPALHQYVYSLAGERRLELTGQRVSIEGEIAGFNGDIVRGTGPVRRHAPGLGLYFLAEGRGNKLPFNWNLLFEQYGLNFAPLGAAVSADRRTYEARAGWRFKNSLLFTGRLQRYEDGWQTSNRTDTMVYGVNLTGPFTVGKFPIAGLSGAFDFYFQQRRNKTRSVADRTISTSLNLTAPINDKTSARAGVFYTNIDNYLDASRSITREASLGLDHSFSLGKINGTVSPGLVVRKLTGAGGDSNQYGPTLSLSLASGGHSFNATYNYLLIDGHTASSTNTHAHSVGLRYAYTTGPHSFGVEFDYNRRDELPGTHTNGYKAAFSYTYRFQRASTPVRARQPGLAVPAASELDLAALEPGLSLADATAILEASGIKGGIVQGNLVSYETRVFARIDQRQRLVLVLREGRLERAIVIVDFTDTGSARTSQRLYRRLLEILVKKYGSPATAERGAFGAQFARDVNAGRFVRIADWRLAGGGSMRLGIPQRLDRRVRIEVQIGPGFPSRRVTRWSYERVR